MIAASKGGFWLLSNGLQSSFKIKEHYFSCSCCGMGEIDVRLIDKLERLRINAKSNFIITNATRCPIHNKKIGGSATSLHLPITTACDLQDINTPIDKLFFHAVLLFNGVGLYQGKHGAYLHVDLRETKCYWYKAKNYNYFTDAKKCFTSASKILYNISEQDKKI